MSVFNMVCKAAEKSGNSLLISAMNKSKLFLIERKTIEFERLQPLIDYVRSEIPLLPFDTCAIEVDMIGADNPEYNVPGIIIIDVSRSTEDDGLRNYDFNFWVGFKLGSVLTLLAGDGFVYENYAAKFMQMLELLKRSPNPTSKTTKTTSCPTSLRSGSSMISLCIARRETISPLRPCLRSSLE